MTALVRTELRKYLTTRLAWGMALAMFGLGAVFSALFGAFLVYGSLVPGGPPTSEVVPPLVLARLVYTAGIQVGYLLALVIGVLSIGQEFRHKTISGTFLATPRRGAVVAAKVVALVLIASGNAVAHVLGCLLGGGVLLAVNDLPLFPEPAELGRTLVLVLLVLALWSLIGLGIGVLIPNQIAALIIAVAAAWIVEPLLGFGLTLVDGGDAVARFFPSQATSATLDLFTGIEPGLASALGGAEDPLRWWAAALVLLSYATAMTVVGWLLTRSRDIA
jgi:ABC-2 type transport system permease protein